MIKKNPTKHLSTWYNYADDKQLCKQNKNNRHVNMNMQAGSRLNSKNDYPRCTTKKHDNNQNTNTL